MYAGSKVALLSALKLAYNFHCLPHIVLLARLSMREGGREGGRERVLEPQASTTNMYYTCILLPFHYAPCAISGGVSI